MSDRPTSCWEGVDTRSIQASNVTQEIIPKEVCTTTDLCRDLSLVGTGVSRTTIEGAQEREDVSSTLRDCESTSNRTGYNKTRWRTRGVVDVG